MDKVIKEFNSKRNKVYLIQNEDKAVVLKIHATKETAIIEAENLTKLLPYANVPKLHLIDSNKLTMEYINGITALDYFLQCEIEKVSELAKLMFLFCKTYVGVLKPYCLSDTNFRNFIVVQNGDEIKLFGVDLEDRDEGTIVNSSASLCAFAFLYDTDIIRKKVFYRSILNELSKLYIEKDVFDVEILKCLKYLIKRRNLEIEAQSILESVESS